MSGEKIYIFCLGIFPILEKETASAKRGNVCVHAKQQQHDSTTNFLFLIYYFIFSLAVGYEGRVGTVGTLTLIYLRLSTQRGSVLLYF